MPALNPVSVMNGIVTPDIQSRAVTIDTKEKRTIGQGQTFNPNRKNSARGQSQENRKRTSFKNNFNI